MSLYTFSPNTVAASSEINANFSGLASGVEITAGAITPEKLLAGTGTSWTPQSWTPSYSGFTTGNGTLNSAKYVQAGRLVVWYWRFTYGTTTAHTDPSIISLPVAAATDFTQSLISPYGGGIYFDTSATTYYQLTCIYRAGGINGIQLGTMNIAGTYPTLAGVGGAVPVAAGSGDVIQVGGYYFA